MQKKGLNVDISIEAHEIIEKYQFDNHLDRKDDAVEKLILIHKKQKV